LKSGRQASEPFVAAQGSHPCGDWCKSRQRHWQRTRAPCD
jgi:hypothetical protein